MMRVAHPAAWTGSGTQQSFIAILQTATEHQSDVRSLSRPQADAFGMTLIIDDRGSPIRTASAGRCGANKARAEVTDS
jgi:hypothetical protein